MLSAPATRQSPSHAIAAFRAAGRVLALLESRAKDGAYRRQQDAPDGVTGHGRDRLPNGGLTCRLHRGIPRAHRELVIHGPDGIGRALPLPPIAGHELGPLLGRDRGALEGLDDEPGALALGNVCASLSPRRRVAIAVEVVILDLVKDAQID